jgi:hypothetical protein
MRDLTEPVASIVARCHCREWSAGSAVVGSVVGSVVAAVAELVAH